MTSIILNGSSITQQMTLITQQLQLMTQQMLEMNQKIDDLRFSRRESPINWQSNPQQSSSPNPQRERKAKYSFRDYRITYYSNRNSLIREEGANQNSETYQAPIHNDIIDRSIKVQKVILNGNCLACDCICGN